MMCDVCDYDFGHIHGCPLDYDEQSEADVSCSLCGGVIDHGQLCIYHPNGDGDGFVCAECIEAFSVSDILEVCGLSTVTEIIAELSGKVMRAGDRY